MKIHRTLPVWVYPLLVIPYISVFWVSEYNKVTPDFMGVPFFYWYQLLWVVISMGILAIAYFSLREVAQPESKE
jgi:hypothetical protein